MQQPPARADPIAPFAARRAAGRTAGLDDVFAAVGAGRVAQWPKVLNASLEEVDPELADIIEHEKNRQYKVRSHALFTCIYFTGGLAVLW